MTFEIPSGTQIEKILTALRDHAMSEAEFADEGRLGVSRDLSEGSWWHIHINEMAPLIVEATTKRIYETAGEAFHEAEQLRDVLVEASGWELKMNCAVHVRAAEDSHLPKDQIFGWFGSVRLRLCAPQAAFE